MDGVSFTFGNFLAALDKHGGSESQVGTKVKGTLFMTDDNGALMDIIAKSSAYLPILEASIYRVSHIAEAGIHPVLEDEFVVLGENVVDDSLIFQVYNQLNAIFHGKGASSSILKMLLSQEINCRRLNKKLAWKFVAVNKEHSRLVLSNCKAVAISKPHIGLGLVVTGIVQDLKPYCAFIDIGGIIGLHSMLARQVITMFQMLRQSRSLVTG